MMSIRYNSPVVLTYAFLSLACLVLPVFRPLGMASPATLAFSDPRFYLSLFSYICVHASWSHYMGNIMVILLVGPLLEEKHGSLKLTEMILVTAAATALLNAGLFGDRLVGGSGIVFMMILLSSFSNFRAREIPLTFLLVAAIFIGSEVTAIFRIDRISQFSHLAGGFIGAVYGFARGSRT